MLVLYLHLNNVYRWTICNNEHPFTNPLDQMCGKLGSTMGLFLFPLWIHELSTQKNFSWQSEYDKAGKCTCHSTQLRWKICSSKHTMWCSILSNLLILILITYPNTHTSHLYIHTHYFACTLYSIKHLGALSVQLKHTVLYLITNSVVRFVIAVVVIFRGYMLSSRNAANFSSVQEAVSRSSFTPYFYPWNTFHRLCCPIWALYPNF